MKASLPRLLRELIRYFGVALVGFVVDFGLLTLCTSVLGWYYLIGATVGFLGGLAVTYALSERFVFSDPRVASPLLRFLIFAVIGLVGLGLLNLLMWVLTSLLGVFYLLSKLIATVIVYAWNFFARRTMYGVRPVEEADEGAGSEAQAER